MPETRRKTAEGSGAWPGRVFRVPGLVLLLATTGIAPPTAWTAGAAQNDPAALYSEGIGQLTRQNWTEAIARFEAVLEIDPAHLPSLFSLASALGSAGENQRAIETYQRLLGLEADLFEARMNLAILLSREGRLEESLGEADQAVALRAEDPSPALFRATLLDRLDRTDAAADAFRGVLSLDPDLEAPRWQLATLLMRSGHLDEARVELTELAGRGSTNPGVFTSLGDIAAGQGRLEEAGERYRRAIGLAGEDPQIALRLALVLDEQGDYAAAIPILERLPDQQAVLAEAYLLAGRFGDARNLYRQLVLEDPEAASFWLGLGRSHYELDNFQDAIGPLEDAVRIDPSLASAWGMLGAIYHQEGDFEAAVPMLQRRLNLLPEDAVTHFMLATALDNLEDFERALLHYNQFLELDDGSNDARTFQVQQRRDSLEHLLLD